MKRAVVFLFVLCFTMLCGCDLFINTDSYQNENINMTPRQISVSNNASTVELVEQVKGAVVGIECSVAGGYSIGSGVAVSDGGYILTNQHVINGARNIIVHFADKTNSTASVVWQDSSQDIAVIRSNVNLPYLVCSNEIARVGEDVIAIGTPLAIDFKHTVTKGIVSAINRTLQIENTNGTLSYMQNLIQHDASINPGNSGGPIINTKGEVIGINTLKASDAEGLGFAIPISIGKTAINKLVNNSTWTPSYMGVLGIDVEVAKFNGKNVNANYGAYVLDIDQTTLCKDCLQKGDIITEINGAKINSVLDMRLAIYNLNSGDVVNIKLIRDDQIIETRCNIGSKENKV